MLLLDCVNPENSIYYLSMYVLQSLRAENCQNLMELYANVIKLQNMPFSKFILCLDWLYLLDIAQMNEKGEVQLLIESLKMN